MNSLRFSVICLCALLASCVSKPPANVDNICYVFKQHPQWYRDALDVQKRWRVPVPVQMAIIHQESKFNGRAKPKRKTILWIIPWKRPSSAYGYTQALNGTWAMYKKSEGNIFTSRTDFSDGVDFIGWYANQAYKRAHISRSDAYSLYLAYHEGVGGYQRKTWQAKPWLVGVAKKVKVRSEIYEAQLNRCQSKLKHRFW
ncbi:transglycosylase SLT domain-containing protein [Legionella sp. CNM-4043-24]|uniref:transglycosylase SLT domain-containing protein n=1 Tax=Legionella sp. CNM-4043-24 TaxID=3421646 RepID=UPI00403B1B0E